MIIDDEKVITGSFNFTKAAQNKNAENVLIIRDKALAKRYLDNWQRRQAVSEALNANFSSKSYNHKLSLFAFKF